MLHQIHYIGRMKNPNKVWAACLPGALFLIAAGWALLKYEQEFLFRAQELSLFLPTSLFYKTLTAYPGGTLSWISAFLIQFFHNPQTGIVLLVALWGLIMALGAAVFRVPARWSGLLLIAPSALLAAIVQTGYFIFYAKLPGYLLMPTVGMLTALCAAGVWRLLPARYGLRLLWMTVWIGGGYPLFGAWSFLGTLCMLLLLWTTDKQAIASGKPSTARRSLVTFLGIALTLIVPLLFYHCYAQTGLAHIYTAGLPNFQVGETTFFHYRYPYLVLALSMLPVAGACRLTPQRMKGMYAFLLQGLLTVALGAGVKACWYRDANFDKELRIARAVERLDWEEVLNIARDGSSGAPTRLIVMNKNLALFRLGRAGDEMFHYPDGGTPPNAPFTVRLAQVGGKPLYMHYGKENFAYRWCMEDCVEFGWNIENLKLMVKTALLNGDRDVARKYLNLLKRTRYYADWACHYETYLEHPDRLAKDPEFAPILHMMTYRDQLDGDNTLVEMYLLKAFANGDGDDPLYQEQTLIAALLLKDIDLFWPRFFKYATLHTGAPHMPTHYQEAVYLYGHLENKVDISQMPFDAEVKDTYERFMAFNRQCGAMSEAQKALAFYPQFGHTFYYYYFLVRNIKTY